MSEGQRLEDRGPGLRGPLRLGTGFSGLRLLLVFRGEAKDGTVGLRTPSDLGGGEDR